MSKLYIPIPKKCPNVQCALLKIAQSGNLLVSREGYKFVQVTKGNGQMKTRKRREGTFPFKNGRR